MPVVSARPPFRLERKLKPVRPTGVGGGPVARSSGRLSASQERGRKQVVWLVLVLFVLAVAEGAIRKWVAPQLGSYIFFLRDPVLLLMYGVATRHRLWPKNSFYFRLSVGMALFGVVLFALQAATGGSSDLRLTLGVYGWRSYFLYTPMAFLVGAVFRREDILTLGKLMFVLSVPIAVLVVAQFAAPPGAPINVGIAEEKEFQFQGVTLNAERTRPCGPFASALAQQQYVATAFAVLLAYFMSPKNLPKPGFMLLAVSAGGLLSCIAVSGSRGTVLQCGLTVVVAIFVALVAKGAAIKGRAILWPAGLTVLALLLYPVVFPEGYEAFAERWVGAHQTEVKGFGEAGVFGRALFGLVDFFGLFDFVPLLGYGLGFGGNAALTLGAKIDGVPVGYLAETDFARHMVDLGPVFGLGYIFFRLALVWWFTAKAIRATRLLSDPMPLMLWSYVGYTLLMATLTGQGTVNFFGWLFLGLLLASCNAPRLPRSVVRTGEPERLAQRTLRLSNRNIT
jgi:hypothetical protein